MDNQLMTEKDFKELITGRKDDGEKTQYSLVPPEALKEIAKVLTFGAKKYAPENWRFVPNASTRYLDALYRHIEAYRMGEKTDSETDLSHLAHAGCCILFLLSLEGNSD